MKFQFLVICGILILSVSVVEAQQTLYAVDSVSNLYTVDPADGSTTLIGPMGIDGISSMAFSPLTGNLYAGTGKEVTGAQYHSDRINIKKCLNNKEIL